VSVVPADPDERLLRLAAQGDEAAFRDFVTRHEAGVWHRALTLTQHREDAEDLLQEVFLAAWRGAGGFRGGSARAWLLTIVGHAWSRQGRRQMRYAELADEDALDALATRAGWGAAGPVTADDPAADVALAFERVAPDDQRLLTLRDIDGMSGEETAALLGVSVAAMKSRLHRARLRLAAAYQEVRDGST
jgi:RNA polymerase sigma-70 factor (ECF subfamily)